MCRESLCRVGDSGTSQTFTGPQPPNPPPHFCLQSYSFNVCWSSPISSRLQTLESVSALCQVGKKPLPRAAGIQLNKPRHQYIVPSMETFGQVALLCCIGKASEMNVPNADNTPTILLDSLLGFYNDLGAVTSHLVSTVLTEVLWSTNHCQVNLLSSWGKKVGSYGE